jgi:hypothetical protein
LGVSKSPQDLVFEFSIGERGTSFDCCAETDLARFNSGRIAAT